MPDRRIRRRIWAGVLSGVLLAVAASAQALPASTPNPDADGIGKFRAAGLASLAQLEAKLAKTPRTPVPVRPAVVLLPSDLAGRQAAVDSELAVFGAVRRMPLPSPCLAGVPLMLRSNATDSPSPDIRSLKLYTVVPGNRPAPLRDRDPPTLDLRAASGCASTPLRERTLPFPSVAPPRAVFRYPGSPVAAALRPLPPPLRDGIAFTNPVAAMLAVMRVELLDEALRTGTLEEVTRRTVRTPADRNRLAWVVRTSPFSSQAYDSFDLIMEMSKASSRGEKIAETRAWAATLGSNTAAAVDYHAIYHLYREHDYDGALRCAADYRVAHSENVDRVSMLEAMSFANKKEFAKAVSSLVAISTSFPDSPLVPQSRFLIGWIHQSEHRTREARKDLQELIRDYPTSEYASSAKALLEGMSK